MATGCYTADFNGEVIRAQGICVITKTCCAALIKPGRGCWHVSHPNKFYTSFYTKRRQNGKNRSFLSPVIGHAATCQRQSTWCYTWVGMDATTHVLPSCPMLSKREYFRQHLSKIIEGCPTPPPHPPLIPILGENKFNIIFWHSWKETANTTLKVMEGCQITFVHKPRPPASLLPYRFAFILTARKSPSVFSPGKTKCFLIFFLINQLLSGPFASCHSCHTCTGCMGLKSNTNFVPFLFLTFLKAILTGDKKDFAAAVLVFWAWSARISHMKVTSYHLIHPTLKDSVAFPRVKNLGW